MSNQSAAVLLLGLVVYFLPWIVANVRRHHQQGAIFVLTLFLGWSGLGWIIALVWSATAVRSRDRAVAAPAKP